MPLLGRPACARSAAEILGGGQAGTQGSFIPKGGGPSRHTSKECAWLTPDETTTHEHPAAGPGDFDVIFVYPWPDEERLTERLFVFDAAVGAVPVTYRESGEFRLRRKTAH